MRGRMNRCYIGRGFVETGWSELLFFASGSSRISGVEGTVMVIVFERKRGCRICRIVLGE